MTTGCLRAPSGDRGSCSWSQRDFSGKKNPTNPARNQDESRGPTPSCVMASGRRWKRAPPSMAPTAKPTRYGTATSTRLSKSPPDLLHPCPASSKISFVPPHGSIRPSPASATLRGTHTPVAARGRARLVSEIPQRRTASLDIRICREDAVSRDWHRWMTEGLRRVSRQGGGRRRDRFQRHARRSEMRGRKQVVACFFGDIAIAVGKFHERIRPAALWNYLRTSSAKIATP